MASTASSSASTAAVTVTQEVNLVLSLPSNGEVGRSKTAEFQLQSTPVDARFVQAHGRALVMDMRLGLGFVPGVTEMDTRWTVCIKDASGRAQRPHTWESPSVPFTRPLQRMPDSHEADKWSRWSRTLDVCDWSQLEALCDQSRLLHLSLIATQFDSKPDIATLTRLMFDRLFQTADQNFILRQTSSLKDALELAGSLRKRNLHLEAQIEQLKVQATEREALVQELHEKQRTLRVDPVAEDGKKKRKFESTTVAAAQLAAMPQTHAQLRLVLAWVQENVLPAASEGDLRALSDTSARFQNAVMQAGCRLRECVVCTEEITQKVCLRPCGHTSVCMTCAAILVANRAPDKADCPVCRAPFDEVQKLY